MATTRKKRKAAEQLPTSQTAKRRENSKTRDKDSSATLLALPAELRNTIYELVLEDVPKIIMLCFFHQPAITRVCTQLRNDVLPMVHALLQTRAWDIALPLCKDKATAQRQGLRNGDAYWKMATLQWQRDLADHLSTTETVYFTARLVLPEPESQPLALPRRSQRIKGVAAAPLPLLKMRVIPNCYVDTAGQQLNESHWGRLAQMELRAECRRGERLMRRLGRAIIYDSRLLESIDFEELKTLVCSFGDRYWDDVHRRLAVPREIRNETILDSDEAQLSMRTRTWV
ncbi:hypothetical protein LTR08_002563 [Meristemomyces frigidus]|nr:hypothetical protein LTR08_002563 [Meristemomyces frigidus]